VTVEASADAAPSTIAEPPSEDPAPAPSAVTDLAALAARLGDDAPAQAAPFGHATLLVLPARIVEALTWLRDEAGYQLLRSVTAVDYLPQRPRFHVVYHLARVPAAVLAGQVTVTAEDPPRELRLKVPVEEAEPIVPTATGVYPTADYHEREVWDMFGIEFRGHPNLARILMPPEFEGHPLRKDFPLMYEEVAFSGNQRSVTAAKPRATE
jgi:NADH-quinone oxidoreductase subunit C